MANVSSIKRLIKDETFQDVLTEVIGREVDVFLNPNSSPEERDEAHDMVRAIGKINDYLDSVIADELIENRRNSK